MPTVPLVEEHDGFLFDLDGVLYAGPAAVPGAPEALKRLKQRGFPVAFVTNNASRSLAEIASHLRELGIPAEEHEVYSSVSAGVTLLAEHVPAPAAVLVTGSEYLKEQVAAAGYTVAASASDQPAAVIQGFEPTLGWPDLAEASYAVNQGALWFATNLDHSVPRDRGIAPGNGALVEAVGRATGTRPLAAGKPQPVMFAQAAQALDLRSPLVIGDRIDTDIIGGNRAGFTTALVLTGIGTAQQAAAATGEERPEWVLRTLDDLFSGDHRSPADV